MFDDFDTQLQVEEFFPENFDFEEIDFYEYQQPPNVENDFY